MFDRVGVVLFAMALAACGRGPAPLTPWSYPYLLYSNAAHGCPLPGMPLSLFRAASNGLREVPTAASSSPGTHRFKGKSVMLDLRVAADTIESWAVASAPSERDARAPSVWSSRQAKGFPERVLAFFAEQPDLAAERKYELLRGCAVPGMTVPEFVAAWGEPDVTDSAASRTGMMELILIYGYGVEGQSTWVGFDREEGLITIERCGPDGPCRRGD